VQYAGSSIRISSYPVNLTIPARRLLRYVVLESRPDRERRRAVGGSDVQRAGLLQAAGA